MTTALATEAVTTSASLSFALGFSRDQASRLVYAAAREHLAMPHDVYGMVAAALDAQYVEQDGVWIAA